MIRLGIALLTVTLCFGACEGAPTSPSSTADVVEATTNSDEDVSTADPNNSQTSNTDAGAAVEDDEVSGPGDDCENGAVKTEACGLNENGQRQQACVDGQWGDWSECVDPDLCSDGDIQEFGCGLNETGVETQICTDGQWASLLPCDDPDVCTNGEVGDAPCGFNGNGSLTTACQEGQWQTFGECADPDLCANGEDSQEPCGLNDSGVQLTICQDGQWNPLGSCDDPDVCINGDDNQESCGLNTNGVQMLLCQLGQWSPVGDCEDPDVCANGAVQTTPCGWNDNGTQNHACESGQWETLGECDDPDICTNSAVGTLLCGLNSNGTEPTTCLEGQWVTTSGECTDPDVCINGDEQTSACGYNGSGSAPQLCSEGQWTTGDCDDPDVCTNTDTGDVSCGLNDSGVATGECQEGQWVATGECIDPDVCNNGNEQTLACGWNGNGAAPQLCSEGQWTTGECDDPDTCANGETGDVSCGLNGSGVAPAECQEGQWVTTGQCSDPDVCTNGDTSSEACGFNGNGLQALICSSGQWASAGDCDDSDMCTNSAEDTLPCGLNGKGAEPVICEAGQWVPSAVCTDPDVCLNGANSEEPCGSVGAGVQALECIDGAWVMVGECAEVGVSVPAIYHRLFHDIASADLILPLYIHHLYGSEVLLPGDEPFDDAAAMVQFDLLRILLVNPSAEVVSVDISVKLFGETNAVPVTEELQPFEYTLVPANLYFSTDQLMNLSALDTPKETSLVVEMNYTDTGEEFFSELFPITIDPKNSVHWMAYIGGELLQSSLQSGGWHDLTEWVATLVTPTAQIVNKVLEIAQEKSSLFKSDSPYHYVPTEEDPYGPEWTWSFQDIPSQGCTDPSPAYYLEGQVVQFKVQATCSFCTATDSTYYLYDANDQIHAMLDGLGMKDGWVTIPAEGVYYHQACNWNWSDRDYQITRTVGMNDGASVQLSAIFDAMEYVTYTHLEAGFGIAQWIPFPSEALEDQVTYLDGSANCIVGSLVFAAALEAIGMEPLIFTGPGHAIPGVKLWPDGAPWFAIESTLVGTQASPTAAILSGTNQVVGWWQDWQEDPTKDFSVVDIKLLREQNIQSYPLVDLEDFQ